jgi:hypothetical protein
LPNEANVETQQTEKQTTTQHDERELCITLVLGDERRVRELRKKSAMSKHSTGHSNRKRGKERETGNRQIEKRTEKKREGGRERK